MLIHHDHQTSKERAVSLANAIRDATAVVMLATIVWLGFGMLNPTNQPVERAQESTPGSDVAPPPRFTPTTMQASPAAMTAAPAILPRSIGADPRRAPTAVEPGEITVLPTQAGVRVVNFVQPPEIGHLTVEVVDDSQQTVSTHDAFGNTDNNLNELPPGTYRLIFGWKVPTVANNEVAISTAGLAMSDAFDIKTGDELVIDILANDA